ncbi:MAG TPA: inorganic diphosphatase [Acidobacteriaceae bacterium]|jgi:inorganic pyrophosphatase
MAKRDRGLQEPTRLEPHDRNTGLFQVIIETPKGSRNKFAYDTEARIFSLKKVLPAGMTFPYDFGFLPRTLAEDGDPLDVLLLMDEPAFPGIALHARLIGVIEGEQIDGKKRVRNDRIVAVADANHLYAGIKKLEDLPRQFVKELEQFFVNYHNLEGKKYKLLGCHSSRTAQRLIEKSSL